MANIPTPKISEILREEFMVPSNLSADDLAKDIKVPTSMIQALLEDRLEITFDTSKRLGRFLGVSDQYFLRVQADIDLRDDNTEI